MTYDEWMPIYAALCKAKDRAKDGEQCRALFDALEDFPTSCVQQACYRAAREVTGWPKSDRLADLARDERRKLTAPAGVCDVCHGSTWVPGPPREVFQRQYETVMDCPQCWTLSPRMAEAR